MMQGKQRRRDGDSIRIEEAKPTVTRPIFAGRLPSIVGCPHCEKTMKVLSYSGNARSRTKAYQLLCIYCRRKFHLWNARLYTLVNGGGVKDVTDTEYIQARMEGMLIKYNMSKE